MLHNVAEQRIDKLLVGGTPEGKDTLDPWIHLRLLSHHRSRQPSRYRVVLVGGRLLVGARENHLLRCLLAGIDTRSSRARLIDWNAADRGFGLILDTLLIGGIASPVGAREARLDLYFQISVSGHIGG